jgi:hypothetical protein
MRSIDGSGVLPGHVSCNREGGGIIPHPALRADLPLKGGGAQTTHALLIESH